jgi:hypothetical protein
VHFPSTLGALIKKHLRPISTHLSHVKDNKDFLVYLLNLPWAEFSLYLLKSKRPGTIYQLGFWDFERYSFCFHFLFLLFKKIMFPFSLFSLSFPSI